MKEQPAIHIPQGGPELLALELQKMLKSDGCQTKTEMNAAAALPGFTLENCEFVQAFNLHRLKRGTERLMEKNSLNIIRLI